MFPICPPSRFRVNPWAVIGLIKRVLEIVEEEKGKEVIVEERALENDADLLNVNNILIGSDPKEEEEVGRRKSSWSNMERIIPIEYTSSPIAEILADSVAKEVRFRALLNNLIKNEQTTSEVPLNVYLNSFDSIFIPCLAPSPAIFINGLPTGPPRVQHLVEPYTEPPKASKPGNKLKNQQQFQLTSTLFRPKLYPNKAEIVSAL